MSLSAIGCETVGTFLFWLIFIDKNEVSIMKANYKDYSNATAKYMMAVEKYLINKYGAVNDEWKQPLTMLATNVELFNQCQERIKNDGLMMVAKNGAYTRNPLIKVANETQVQIVKLLNEFGITPKAAAKINLVSDDSDELKELLGD